MSNQQGAFFITIEGSEGVGKSTATHYVTSLLADHDIDFIQTREPGGTPIAELIRSLLLDHHEERMSEDTELLLMFAGRAQHLSSVIKPALAMGKWVVCDRFTDASYAYQGGGRGIIDEKIVLLENFVQKDLRPDVTLLLDAPCDISLARAHNRSAPDRFEQEKIEFFARVRAKYLERAKLYPQRFYIVDATQSIEEVQRDIKLIIEKKIMSSTQCR